MLLLRIVAISRTKFWLHPKVGRLFKWRPTGFTIEFTLRVLKQEPRAGCEITSTAAEGEESQLIET